MTTPVSLFFPYFVKRITATGIQADDYRYNHPAD